MLVFCVRQGHFRIGQILVKELKKATSENINKTLQAKDPNLTTHVRRKMSGPISGKKYLARNFDFPINRDKHKIRFKTNLEAKNKIKIPLSTRPGE